jgi:hypothetical protein
MTIDNKMSEKKGHGHDDEHGHTSTHGGDTDSVKFDFREKPKAFAEYVKSHGNTLFAKLMGQDGAEIKNSEGKLNSSLLENIANTVHAHAKEHILKYHLKANSPSDELKDVAEEYLPSKKDIMNHFAGYDEVNRSAIQAYVDGVHAQTLLQKFAGTVQGKFGSEYDKKGESKLDSAKKLTMDLASDTLSGEELANTEARIEQSQSIGELGREFGNVTFGYMRNQVQIAHRKKGPKYDNGHDDYEHKHDDKHEHAHH